MPVECIGHGHGVGAGSCRGSVPSWALAREGLTGEGVGTSPERGLGEGCLLLLPVQASVTDIGREWSQDHKSSCLSLPQGCRS